MRYFIALYTGSVGLSGGRFTGKAGEFLVVNQAAIRVEPDKAGCAAVGKGEFRSQVAVAVLVKVCIIAALERGGGSGKRFGISRDGEQLSTGSAVPEIDLRIADFQIGR